MFYDLRLLEGNGNTFVQKLSICLSLAGRYWLELLGIFDSFSSTVVSILNGLEVSYVEVE